MTQRESIGLRLELRMGLVLALALAGGGCGTESSVAMDSGGDGAGATVTGTGGVQAGTGGALASAGGRQGTGGIGSGVAGMPGDGAGAAGGDSGDGVVMERPDDCERGMTTGGSVLLIGDSYVDLNLKAFGTELMRLAREEGSLAQGDAYVDRSVSGSQMSGVSLLGLIPAQYTLENNADGHVKTVVMDGGGNDVLVGNRSCIDSDAPPSNASCVATLDDVTAAFEDLLGQMASDGVQDVVYFFYPHLPGGGLGGNKELTNATVDYAIDRMDGPNVASVCANAPLNCIFVDTRGLFPAQPAEFQDGIHPTVANTQKISRRVWEAMKGGCIAQ